jgi:hypothetical protein
VIDGQIDRLRRRSNLLSALLEAKRQLERVPAQARHLI